ncbi:6-phosphofructo-2-kinase/fructose-2,6-bisphosphatase-like [Diospyros lotus]|uniref:6-phosphofructo-2-kinase/fructose-2, 6-bisphosphatase-like n=1 Tax=Diospyros lotus TaxID=55363 RepID=UPI00225C06BD|nr:6-phosphofructo-2-kinase/fructose-2,6-bisphosphatase-like [Diospyros lotus]XP_052203475.1 6-phosphofructo-2-kinase/fructose-2,6-bisphosphatase-like [Diospyros lotus]
MMDDSDDDDDFGHMIANPSGKGVRRNAQQHNHWGNHEYKLNNGFSVSLELDLEHYVVTATSTFANSSLVYVANMTEIPRLLTHTRIFSSPEGSGIASLFKDGGVSSDRCATVKEMEAMVVDSFTVYSGSGMVESKVVGTYSPLRLQKQNDHRGLYVERGVGSPMIVNSGSATAFSINLKLDSETKNTVVAVAIADQVLRPKEDLSINILSDGETVGSHGISLYLKQLQKNASPGKKNLQMNSEAVEKLKSKRLMKGEGPMIRSTRLEKRSR